MSSVHESSGSVDPNSLPYSMLQFADEPVRIAMWSGPRNISTAMMRAFENRPDTAVIDEPFYGAYLVATGLEHPMRAEVIASQSFNWRDIAAQLIGPIPDDRPVFYQKHMTHHMLPEFGRDWIDEVSNAFLIRRPESVLASYAEKRGDVTLRDIGLIEQVQLFEAVADRLGHAPPVIDSADILANPPGALKALCRAIGIPFMDEMLAWPEGRRPTDGVWAPVWYHAVEASTGFAESRPDVRFEDLAEHLKPIAEAARPLYERMQTHRLLHAAAADGDD